MERTLPFVIALVIIVTYLTKLLQSVKADFGLKTIPVLVLSTSCSHFDVKAAYSLGANSYLQKPSRYNELVLMLNRVLTFWLKHDLSRKVSGLS